MLGFCRSKEKGKPWGISHLYSFAPEITTHNIPMLHFQEDERLYHASLGIASKLAKYGSPHSVITLTGAGISCASGIPVSSLATHESKNKEMDHQGKDFRSPGGIYSTRGAQNVFRTRYPSTQELAEERLRILGTLSEACRNGIPSPAHFLVKDFYDLGMLQRSYTQNVDDLHEKAGLTTLDRNQQQIHVTLHGTMGCVHQFVTY